MLKLLKLKPKLKMTMTNNQEAKDQLYMKKAIKLAMMARDKDEVPIGCVVVKDGKVIGAGYNIRNSAKNTLGHGEIIAIDRACRYLKDWRLEGCTIYVTLEPCPMCAGAILQSRADRLVFGASSPKGGSVGSLVNVLESDGYNHRVEIKSGVLEPECGQLLRDFFKKFRK